MRLARQPWAALLFLLGACGRESPSEAPSSFPAVAQLKDTQGRDAGRVLLWPVAGGVRLGVSVHGLPPGAHGFHIHESGECQAPHFKSAGGHFNPDGRKHGLQNPKGPHAGDLPNLEVGPDGRAVVEVVARGVTLSSGPRSILRRSLVVHERPDDGRTDPDGNAGARIACGEIREEGPRP